MDKILTPSVLLFGATGLVGSYVLEQLIADITVQKIIVFTRSPLTISLPKIKNIVTDFTNLNELATHFMGSTVLYCCIGTTIKKVKTKEAFKAVDYDLPVQLAGLAKEKGVKKFIALSSLGADANSKNFYLRTKGEMERDVLKYKFQKLAFLRPSVLIGNRKEVRPGERFLIFMLRLTTPLLRGKLKKYRPIQAEAVAKAMLNVSKSLNNNHFYESEELVWLGS